jgi:putative N6-adenine-specific DNA methylase
MLLLFEYKKYQTYFAQAAGTLESLCEQELRRLGAKKTNAVYRGVRFQADNATLYRINYTSRIATRVLAPLLTFSCHSAKYLTRTALSIPWEKFLNPSDTFAITSSVANSAIKNSLYAAQCLKDGIADYFSARSGKRPSVDLTHPTVRFNLHVDNNKAVISLDTSGESLHKRGYRQSGGAAPLQETLAAALVALSGWDEEQPFWDCMCGSATIVTEAHMKYCRIPAQFLRKEFGFFRLPDFSKQAWDTVKSRCDAHMRPAPPGLIRGSDKSAQSVEKARRNAGPLPYSESIAFKVEAFQDAPPFTGGVIVTNPPYGVRIGEKSDLPALYKSLGDFFKQGCKGSAAYVLVGDKQLKKSIGLRPSGKVPLQNGPIACEFLRFDIFEGYLKDQRRRRESSD